MIQKLFYNYVSSYRAFYILYKISNGLNGKSSVDHERHGPC